MVRPPMPSAEASARPAPFAARRACGVNGDRDDAGGHSKELLAAGVGECRGTGRRQIDREGLSAARPAGRRHRHRAGTTAAVRSSTKLAVSDVALPTMTLVTVTPPPLTFTVVAPTTKLVPVSVTATVVPRMP